MVKLVESTTINGKHVVRGKVMHSMSVTNPCLTPWIIISGTEILSAHCDCVAGVGEVCSHVGAVLYHLTSLHHQELVNQLTQPEPVSVTEREQQWGRPNKSITENLQQQIQEIDYGNKLCTFDNAFGNVPRLGIDELRESLNELQCEGIQCAAMQEFCANRECFRCAASRIDDCYSKVGIILDGLYDPSFDNKSIEQLRFMALQLHSNMKLNMNELVRIKIENETRDQWKSELWKRIRVGRITASILKSVCSTNLDKPSRLVVKKICYPDLTYFSTQATRHGKSMEKVAFNHVANTLKRLHENSSVTESGLIIDERNPELAASPDGILHCSCCNRVPLEIKCPFRFKNENDIIAKLTKVQQPYIIKSSTGYDMVKTHPYYAQVQMQIAVLNAEYGYFYVWTKTEDLLITVNRDLNYWQDMQLKATTFFKAVILPELIPHK